MHLTFCAYLSYVTLHSWSNILVEALRAKKYRKILGSLAGEDGTAQPQAAGTHHMPLTPLKLTRAEGSLPWMASALVNLRCVRGIW